MSKTKNDVDGLAETPPAAAQAGPDIATGEPADSAPANDPLRDELDASIAQNAQLTAQVMALEDKCDRLVEVNSELRAKVQKASLQPRSSRAPKPPQPRRAGPLDGDKPMPAELLEAIKAAETVELVFSDGERELPELLPVRIEGDAWRVTAAGLQMQPNDLSVEGPGPSGRPYALAGYGLLLDGELFAYAARPEVLMIGPGSRFDLSNDVVF